MEIKEALEFVYNLKNQIMENVYDIPSQTKLRMESQEKLSEVEKLLIKNISGNNWEVFWALNDIYEINCNFKDEYMLLYTAQQSLKNKVTSGTELFQIYLHILQDLSLVCLTLNKFKDALYYSEMVFKFNFNDIGVICNYAMSLLMNKQPGRALDIILNALKKSPHDQILNNNLNLIQAVLEGKIKVLDNYFNVIYQGVKFCI
jgi:hypothetical protein